MIFLTAILSFQCFDYICWVSRRALSRKNLVMRCWCGCLSEARCKWIAW